MDLFSALREKTPLMRWMRWYFKNSHVFKDRLKLPMLMSGSRSSTSREFQTDGPATEKARRRRMCSAGVVGQADDDRCGIVFSSCPSVRLSVCPWTSNSRDVISLYLVEGFQWNLSQIFISCVENAEKVFKVRGQRSRSYVYKCMNAITAEAYIWRRGLLV